ncbi:MAG: hypothetical protein IPL46_22540 [Saprospiraceae bacterium]|nr:hypothetical protein [Saprospiraceae bacterium]
MNSPVLLISATLDDVWPSTLMCDKIIERLNGNNFQFFYKHLELQGGHAEFTRNYGLIFEFLNQYFPN